MYRVRKEERMYILTREKDNFRTHNGVFSRVVTSRKHFVHKEHKLELSLPMSNSSKNTPLLRLERLGGSSRSFYGTYTI